MKIENNINYIRRHIELFVTDKTTIIDATCGNGNDTLYLAQKYPNNEIIGFDIQQEAINNSKKRCQGYTNVNFILDSHQNLDEYVKSNVSLAVFNLGYLPRADENITTKAKSTIIAIQKIMDILISGGGIIITLYRGEANIEETELVLEFVKTINKDFFIVSMYDLINLDKNPFNIIIERK